MLVIAYNLRLVCLLFVLMTSEGKYIGRREGQFRRKLTVSLALRFSEILFVVVVEFGSVFGSLDIGFLAVSDIAKYLVD